MSNNDLPLRFHKSIGGVLDTFRNMITSMTWLKVSIKEAENFFKTYPYIIELNSSVTKQKIKIDKSILKLVESEGFNKKTPLYSKVLIDYYRVFTIAVKDILWNETDFQPLLNEPELQFLRHLRNASAHDNKFFWGRGQQRERTIAGLPVSWQGKVIEENLETKPCYMDFMKPGDVFILLSDISKLA